MRKIGVDHNRRCARSLYKMASKIIKHGASMSQRRIRMAWQCSKLVVRAA